MSHLPPPVKPMTRVIQDCCLGGRPSTASFSPLDMWPPFRCDRLERPGMPPSRRSKLE